MNTCDITAVSVLVPVYGNLDVERTIHSIASQNLERCEVIILYNGKPEYADMGPYTTTGVGMNMEIKQVYLPFPGKARALNIGIALAQYEFIAVVDADCILGKRALRIALRHFNHDNVAAVGCKLRVQAVGRSLLGRLQCIEYEKAFCFSRILTNAMHCDYLISGAFGVFRKSALVSVGGYSERTVGEDMELVLRMQFKSADNSRYSIVYDKRAVAYTKVPTNIIRLLHQRERWQRGLVDCILRHRRMIGNRRYGLLGTVALPLIVLIDVLGPIAIICGAIGLFHMIILKNVVVCYMLFDYILTLFVDVAENGIGFRIFLYSPIAALLTIIGIGYQIVLSFARVYGMLTFYWRRMVW